MILKSIISTKGRRLAVASVLAAGLLAGGVAVANGAVKPDCKTLSYPLCPRSVAASQVVDNSLPKSKIAPADRDAFLADVKGEAQVSKDIAPTVIKYIGGRYLDPARGATYLGTFTLPSGRWLVNATVKFNRTVEGDAGVRPMLALRVGQTPEDFGDDYGTVSGVDISKAKDADLFGSSIKLVTVSGSTVVKVYGFGYTDTRGTEGSGEITAAVQVVAVRA